MALVPLRQSIYLQYKRYKHILREPKESLKDFLENYQNLQSEIELDIISKLSKQQIEVLHLLSSCNLAQNEADTLIYDCNNYTDDLYVKTLEKLHELGDNLESVDKTESEEIKVEVEVKEDLDSNDSTGDLDFETDLEAENEEKNNSTEYQKPVDENTIRKTQKSEKDSVSDDNSLGDCDFNFDARPDVET